MDFKGKNVERGGYEVRFLRLFLLRLGDFGGLGVSEGGDFVIW